jgi:PPOX class probable F420-dependent enzyme
VPRPPLPPDLDAFLARANPAVIATSTRDGAPHSAATWYDWEDGRVLLNMAATRVRLVNLRANPRASLTVLGERDWYRQVTLVGPIVSLEDDDDLADIDRLSQRYLGRPFERRGQARVTAWLEPERWHSWPLPPGDPQLRCAFIRRARP